MCNAMVPCVKSEDSVVWNRWWWVIGTDIRSWTRVILLGICVDLPKWSGHPRSLAMCLHQGHLYNVYRCLWFASITLHEFVLHTFFWRLLIFVLLSLSLSLGGCRLQRSKIVSELSCYNRRIIFFDCIIDTGLQQVFITYNVYINIVGSPISTDNKNEQFTPSPLPKYFQLICGCPDTCLWSQNACLCDVFLSYTSCLLLLILLVVAECQWNAAQLWLL